MLMMMELDTLQLLKAIRILKTQAKMTFLYWGCHIMKKHGLMINTGIIPEPISQKMDILSLESVSIEMERHSRIHYARSTYQA
jgi:hypothetical protein